MEGRVLEDGERCHCGGEVDKLYLIEPHIWQGRCFQCGEKSTVVIRETRRVNSDCVTEARAFS